MKKIKIPAELKFDGMQFGVNPQSWKDANKEDYEVCAINKGEMYFFNLSEVEEIVKTFPLSVVARAELSVSDCTFAKIAVKWKKIYEDHGVNPIS